jgi:hypothetical protein
MGTIIGVTGLVCAILILFAVIVKITEKTKVAEVAFTENMVDDFLDQKEATYQKHCEEIKNKFAGIYKMNKDTRKKGEKISVSCELTNKENKSAMQIKAEKEQVELLKKLGKI